MQHCSIRKTYYVQTMMHHAEYNKAIVNFHNKCSYLWSFWHLKGASRAGAEVDWSKGEDKVLR